MRRFTPLVVAGTLLLSGCWTQVGFGPARSGSNPVESEITAANVAQLRRAWTLDVGDETNAPIVVGGTVFATATGVATALDTATGAVRWRTAIDDQGVVPSLGPPTFDGAQVLAPLQFQGVGGHYAFDPATGARSGSPAFHHLEIGSIASDLHGLHAVVTIDFGSGTPFLETLSYGGQRGFIAFDTSVPPATDAAILAPHVVIAAATTVESFPIGPCDEVPPPFPSGFCSPEWQRDVGSVASAPIGVDAGHIAVGTAAGDVVVHDVASGAVVWRGHTGTGALRPPASDGTHLFAASSDGHLYAFDATGCGAADCAPDWSGDLRGPASYQPAIAGGVVYAATTNGRVRAFVAGGCGAATCTARWTRRPTSTALVGPVVSNGGVYVVASDGRVIAYRLPG